jgi:hypothetical protein
MIYAIGFPEMTWKPMYRHIMNYDGVSIMQDRAAVAETKQVALSGARPQSSLLPRMPMSPSANFEPDRLQFEIARCSRGCKQGAVDIAGVLKEASIDRLDDLAAVTLYTADGLIKKSTIDNDI